MLRLLIAFSFFLSIMICQFYNYVLLILHFWWLFGRHGQRFAFWTEEAKRLLQGILQPVFRVQKRKAVTQEVPMHVQVAVNRAAEEELLVDSILQSTGAEQHLVVLCSHTIQINSQQSFSLVISLFQLPQDFLFCLCLSTGCSEREPLTLENTGLLSQGACVPWQQWKSGPSFWLFTAIAAEDTFTNEWSCEVHNGCSFSRGIFSLNILFSSSFNLKWPPSLPRCVFFLKVTILFLKAIIYGLSALHHISMQDAEEAFLSGPQIHQR